MTEIERRVRAVVYHSLLEQGRAPSVVVLASQLDLTDAQVNAALRALAEAHAIVLRPGTDDLWMAHPFSAVETELRRALRRSIMVRQLRMGRPVDSRHRR